MRSTAELADASMQAAVVGDREGWLALYAEDAVLEDPVGPSPWDPEGRGHRGKRALAAFWDRAIGPNRGLQFKVRERYTGGKEVASVLTVSTAVPGGQRIELGMVTIHRSNEQGLIQSLRAFWNSGS
jgi:ketosteroid isomerase-like protein